MILHFSISVHELQRVFWKYFEMADYAEDVILTYEVVNDRTN
jgi:hypothetical protein